MTSGLFLGLCIMMMIVAIPAIFRPDLLYKESRENRDRRLEELRRGAPEAYFEEQRELESYEPRFNPSNKTLRTWGIAAFVLGLISVLQGLTQ